MKNIVLYALVTLVVVVLSLVTYHGLFHEKNAYVDLGKLYSDFELKKEYEGKYTGVESARKKITDSLELQLTSLRQRLEMMDRKDKKVFETAVQEFELKRQDYILKKKNFDEDNDNTAKKYDEQIWKQLNQYVQDYGKEKGYDYILGSNGSGNVMHVKEAHDITAEVLTYINKKYKGI